MIWSINNYKCFIWIYLWFLINKLIKIINRSNQNFKRIWFFEKYWMYKIWIFLHCRSTATYGLHWTRKVFHATPETPHVSICNPCHFWQAISHNHPDSLSYKDICRTLGFYRFVFIRTQTLHMIIETARSTKITEHSTVHKWQLICNNNAQMALHL